MKTIFADFNSMTESGHVALSTRGSRADIERAKLGPGDWAWLSDSEVLVGAQLAIDDRYGLVGVPDWDTLVHLDDEDSRDSATVQRELERLSQKCEQSRDDERRILELLTISEVVAPGDFRNALPQGFFSSRRAETLYLVGKHELALSEVQEARRQGSVDSDDLRLLLDILRRTDLARAKHEAETIAERPDVVAGVLAECINVLADHADNLPDDQFEAVGEKILTWVERFGHAPGYDEVLPSTRALAHFNRAMTLLRLDRNDGARDALRLARAADSVFSEIAEAMGLTVYDQHARDLAARVRARLIAAST